MRKRLRPKWPDKKLKEIYAKPHDHKLWIDHHLRVDVTSNLVNWLFKLHKLNSVADLSCGNAAIINRIPLEYFKDFGDIHIGDYAPGHRYVGSIEETIFKIPRVDLFICSETLEHLDDPDSVLKDIREKTEFLVLSTPTDAFWDNNPEHYWAWSKTEISNMLDQAGFKEKLIYLELDLRKAGYEYCYQIWAAK